MKILNSFRTPPAYAPTGFLVVVIILAIAMFGYSSGKAQPSYPSLVDSLHSRIQIATKQHSPPDQLGTLWLKLATVLQNEYELQQAEVAFNQALSLLRSPAMQPALADALQGLGALYFETGRPVEAEKCLRSSLTIVMALGRQDQAAAIHETIAMELVFAHKFREGEAESLRALNLLQSQDNPDSSEIISALVTHSYALCFQNRCSAAIDDAARAMVLAKGLFPTDSPQFAAIWMALGFAQWKSGLDEQGGASMREAIRIVNNQTNLPPLLQLRSQLVVFRQYADYLRATHRRLEAARFKAQILQLESQPLGCSNCTINAVALTDGLPHQ
jgi:tetratricopeptide (TPR) repeat protein